MSVIISTWYQVRSNIHRLGVFVLIVLVILNPLETLCVCEVLVSTGFKIKIVGHGKGSSRDHPPESEAWRRRFGTCFTLKIPESSRNRPSS